MEKAASTAARSAPGFCLRLPPQQPSHLVLPPQNIVPSSSSNGVSVASTADTSHQQFINEAQQRLIESFDSSSSSYHDSNDGAQQTIQQATTTTSAEGTGLAALAAVVNVNEKVAIYRHPLFPLLRVLFEKCEIATNSIEHVGSINFDNEIKIFITQMAKDNKPFFTDDVEVDTLMLKALQVLAIHLLELEKVNELCKDFCTRYISCLKGKLNSENIMRTLDIQNTPPGSPPQTQSSKDIKQEGINVATPDRVETPLNQQPQHMDISDLATHASAILNPSTQRSASTSCMEDTSPKEDFTINRSASVDGTGFVPNALNGMTLEQLTSGFLTKKNKGGKRGTLPKLATNVLKAWLFQHLVHPYPSEEEKKQLAQQTNLSILQVNNWFINARRRIIQPMLDSSNTVLKNNKKSKQPRNAAQKDWSNTIEVYNAFRSEMPNSQTLSNQQQQMGLVVSPIVPTAGTVLLNLGGESGASQPMIISQPLQFVQVNQVPAMQAIAPTGYLPLQTVSTQSTSTTATSQHQQAAMVSVNVHKTRESGI